MTDYFVATAAGGGDDAHPGTIGEPLLTIEHAKEHVVAGDTLYIRGGTYHEEIWWDVDGTVSDRILISAYPTETVIIDGEYTIPVVTTTFLVTIAGDYVTIQNITVYRSKGACLSLAGDYSYAVNVIGDHAYESGIIAQATNNIIDTCTMSGNGEGYGIDGQIYWGSAIGATGFYALIKNCLSHDNRGEGYNPYAGSHHITFEDNIGYDNGCGQYLDSCHDILVQRCFFYHTIDANLTHTSVGISFGNETAQPYNITVINNIVAYWGLNMDAQVISGTVTNWLIANNIFFNSQKTQADINDGYNMNVYFRNFSLTYVNCTFENNIVVEEDARITPITLPASHSGFTFDYNCWSKTPTASAQGANDAVGDPLLVKADTYANPLWYKLHAGSPCRNAGIALSEVTEDYWETERADPPCIGAHEYEEEPIASVYGPAVWMDG